MTRTGYSIMTSARSVCMTVELKIKNMIDRMK